MRLLAAGRRSGRRKGKKPVPQLAVILEPLILAGTMRSLQCWMPVLSPATALHVHTAGGRDTRAADRSSSRVYLLPPVKQSKCALLGSLLQPHCKHCREPWRSGLSSAAGHLLGTVPNQQSTCIPGKLSIVACPGEEEHVHVDNTIVQVEPSLRSMSTPCPRQ